MFFDPSLVVEEHVFAQQVTESTVDYWQIAQQWSGQAQDVLSNVQLESLEAYLPKLMTLSGSCIALVSMIVVLRIGYWISSRCASKCRRASQRPVDASVSSPSTTIVHEPRGSGSSGWIHTLLLRLALFVQQVKLWLLQCVESFLNKHINFMSQSLSGSMSMLKFGHRQEIVDEAMLRQIASHIEDPRSTHEQVVAMCNYTVTQISAARTRGDYMRAQQLTVIHDQLSRSLSNAQRR